MATRRTKNPSVMAHSFAQVPTTQIQRSVFRRNHGHKTTLDLSGLLYPVYVDEALPGDTFSMSANVVCRLATPLHPIMDNLVMDLQFFAVPNRILWDSWVHLMGERENPGDPGPEAYAVPHIEAPAGDGFVIGSIYDYLGIPTGVENLQVSSLPLRAYNLIYKEWYRSQDLVDSPTINKGDGPDNAASYQLLRRGKRHDYFTSALPFPQKGDQIDLPLGGTAPVTGDVARNGDQYPTWTPDGVNPVGIRGNTAANADMVHWTQVAATDNQYYWDNPNLIFENGVADLSEATATSINSLREAFQMQRMLERDARSGTRYQEVLLSHFKIYGNDGRLQRPEFLGGGTIPIQFNPVPQTSSTADSQGPVDTPQGNLAAVAYGVGGGIRWNKSFVEHCTIIGLASVRADLTYQTGLNKLWSRRGRYDFYWPALAHLGEEPILNKEIYAQGTAEDEEVFGYNEAWASYRYHPSLITGKMRSVAPDSLDTWHLSQDFDALPVLNAAFIGENPPIDRIIAVQDEPHFIFDSYFDVRCARPMPLYSVPGLIDHF